MKPHLLALTFLLATSAALATESADETDDDGEVAAVAEPAPGGETKLEEKLTEAPAESFRLIGAEVPPGTQQTLRWFSPQAPGGLPVPIPVIVVNGSRPGPVLCLTAAIHGDELNGIEIARRVLNDLSPDRLKGVVVGVPIVNLEGFWRRDRYIGDRRDLNRFFPGSPDGSYPARVAFALFDTVIRSCDALVDLHTGSFYRENLPQLRADLTVEAVAALSKQFGGITVLHSEPPPGSLRGAATAAGIPTVVMEVGGPLSLEPAKVELGEKSIWSLLHSLGMVEKYRLWSRPQPVYYGSKWIRAEVGGILINGVELGAKVKEGDHLAEIFDPIGNREHQVTAPFDGTVLGRAQNQYVSPGFAIFRIGFERTLEELTAEGEAEKKAAVERDSGSSGAEEPRPDGEEARSD